MSEVQNQGFLFGQVNDQDESLKSKVGGVFGLNPGVFFTNIAYNPNAGKDGAAADAVEVAVKIGDREYRKNIYDLTGEIYNSNNEMVAPGGEGYAEAYNSLMKQRMAVIIHAVKATGVTQEMLDTALATPLSNFVEWAKVVTALVPTDYKSRPIDCFLQYQWKMKKDQDRTYLELAENMKGGRFLCPSIAHQGSWTAVNDDNGLRYLDEAGQEHPFTRSKNFMESPKAYRQVDGEDNGPDGATNSNFSESDKAAASKAKW